MKKIYIKQNSNNFKTLLALMVALIVIIHSCKKDEKQAALDTATANKISEAKEWYQKNYPIVANNSSLKTQGLSNSGNNDFSQVLKPDWGKVASYYRLNNDVIEMPLDSAAKLALVDKSVNIQSFNLNKSYSKSSFLILNNGNGYSAYIMTIVADTSYLQNDFSKLSNNTYRKQDKDFSGYLLYYTTKGVFVSGWHYLNGKINKTLSVTTASSNGVKTESTSNSKLKLLENGCSVQSFSVYTYGYVNGQLATIFIDIYYFYVCTEMGHQPDPGDGGPPGVPSFPPNVSNITNIITMPCLNSIVTNLSISGTLNNNVTQMLRNTFGTSDQVNINFSDASTLASGADAETSGSSYNNMDVVFNKSQLANASQEFLAETAIHEIYHAYLYVNPSVRGNLSQHLYMAQNYVNNEVAALQQQFPSLSLHDAQCLVIGGYGELQTGDPQAFNSILSAYGYTLNDISTTNNNYKTGNTGTHC